MNHSVHHPLVGQYFTKGLGFCEILLMFEPQTHMRHKKSITSLHMHLYAECCHHTYNIVETNFTTYLNQDKTFV